MPERTISSRVLHHLQQREIKLAAIIAIESRQRREQVFQEIVHLAPVVQTLDSAIHRIYHYPADKY